MTDAALSGSLVIASIVANQAIEEAVRALQILDVDHAVLVRQLGRQRNVDTALKVRTVGQDVRARHESQLQGNDPIQCETARQAFQMFQASVHGFDEDVHERIPAHRSTVDIVAGHSGNLAVKRDVLISGGFYQIELEAQHDSERQVGSLELIVERPSRSHL